MANTKNTHKNTSAAKKSGSPISVRIDSLRNDDSHIKGTASISLNGKFAVHGFTILEGKNGLFVNMPQRSYNDKFGEKKYNDVFHAVTKDAHEELNSSILDAYEQALAESQAQSDEEAAEEVIDESDGLAPEM